MNIGIDVTPLKAGFGGGIKTFLFQALKSLVKLDKQNQYFLYTNKPVSLTLDLPDNWHWRIGDGFLAKSSILWLQTAIRNQTKRDKIDCFWGPRYVLPFLNKEVFKIATIFDLFYLLVPHTIKPVNRFLDKHLIVNSAKTADLIVATSQATADDLANYLKVAKNKILVLHGAADEELFNIKKAKQLNILKKYQIEKKYILASDIFNPRKNFSLVAKAYASLPNTLKQKHRLVGLGSPHNIYKPIEIHKLLKELKIAKFCDIIPHVPLEHMAHFYGGAEVFCFPSLYEGFGLPIVEAMACGCPVITGNHSSMPEAAGEAAILINVKNVDEMYQALKEILTNPNLRENLIKKGFKQEKKFSWDNYAQGLLTAFVKSTEKEGK